MPPRGSRSILYLLVDDLRPELPPWGSTHVHAPYISKLAATGTVFTNSYCQQAVCSPSRMSFLSGRRPGNTRTFNFLNHFRQAWCGAPTAGRVHTGVLLRNVSLAPAQCRERFGRSCGGADECCTACTAEPDCSAWTYLPLPPSARGGGSSSRRESETRATQEEGAPPLCMLFKTTKATRIEASHSEPPSMSGPGGGALSGESGAWDTANWTSMPQHFRNHGYFVLGTGKVFHDGTGGVNAPWHGPGMPPLNDPPAWTPGCSMQDADSDAYMWPCSTPVYSGGEQGQGMTAHGCAINASLQGDIAAGEKPLADKIVADDAVAKLELAAAALHKTGRPFFLASGFRKPHMDWRFPKPFLDFYPDADQIRCGKCLLNPSKR